MSKTVQYDIHPVADLFPMMSDEELQTLAADIAANGIVHPIILDEQNQIIDGRNRMAACKLAGVDPKFEQLNGRDPLAYIVSANLARRNLTKGQQAMALAMIYPEPEKGGRGKKSEVRNREETSQFSIRRVQQARSILRHSRDLAEAVIKGAISLDDALETVDQAKQAANSTAARLAHLQKCAPDLAARVTDENISLDEAITILNQRESDLRKAREAGREAARLIIGFAVDVSTICSAIHAGEEIHIPSDVVNTIQNAYELFMNLEKKV